ncbi:MAG: MarR family transcriptional regulator [Rhodoglobus sp.]
MAVELEALGRSIKILQWRHHRALEVGLAAVGTTLAQWDALRAIDRNPGASAHQLAVATFQSDQAFGALATRLESQGLIERTPGQGRRIVHGLTPAGQRMLQAGYPVPVSVLAASFGDFTEAERQTLLALVTRAIGTEAD